MNTCDFGELEPELVDPHQNELVDPHQNELVDPHQNELVDPHHSRHGKHKTPRLKIKVDPHQLAKLQEWSDEYGYTVSSLVRWCIKNSLESLEADLKAERK